MSTQIGSAAVTKVMQLMVGGTGVSSTFGGLALEGAEAPQVLAQNVAADLAERSGLVQYPVVSIYCEKIVNDLREKFRSFSGTVELAIEVRHSQDRLEGIETALEQYADAATQTLNTNRGDWGGGIFYAGGYQVAFGSVKRGGKNFTQVAKVTFEVGVSLN